MSTADSYILSPSSGTSFTSLSALPINTSKHTVLRTPSSITSLRVFIANYRGLPSSSPSTHPYFSSPVHTHDLYSLQFSFSPTAPIPGDDLVLGNSFDEPIRDKLPYGFSAAWRAFKWIDPSAEGDMYADKPSVFSPVLAAVNYIRVEKVEDGSGDEGEECIVKEDMSAAVKEFGEEIPADGGARRKLFLSREVRDKFVFLPGYIYTLDFCNGYLDFNNFTVKLPGFSISLLNYWGGQPGRYELKNRVTEEKYAVVQFELVEKEKMKEKKEEIEKEGGNADGEID